ncbi:MAG: L,D-transpeptidase [Verrucomicrobiales bacterium]
MRLPAKTKDAIRKVFRILSKGSIGIALVFAGSCSSIPKKEVVVSVREQRVAVLREGKALCVYPCSTSKFGLGDRRGTFATPTGKLAVARKIGGGAPPGMVFKSRRPTGEVLPANAPGRDPIVTRIIWLRGLQSQNRQAYGRCIYIHGTPEECALGRPASYGCVRMCSHDIIDLFNLVDVGTPVRIQKSALPREAARLADAMAHRPQAPLRGAPQFAPVSSGPTLLAHQTFAPPPPLDRR